MTRVRVEPRSCEKVIVKTTPLPSSGHHVCKSFVSLATTIGKILSFNGKYAVVPQQCRQTVPCKRRVASSGIEPRANLLITNSNGKPQIGFYHDITELIGATNSFYYSINTYRYPNANEWTVYVGETDQVLMPSRAQIAQVTDLVQHEGYDEDSYENDITLLRLNKHLNMNNAVQTICVPPSNHQLPQNITSVLHIAARHLNLWLRRSFAK